MLGSGQAELDQQADGTSSCHGGMALTAILKKRGSESKNLNIQFFSFFMSGCRWIM
jgi:hypothetical protein